VSNDDFLQATMGAMDLVYNIARRMVPRREDAEDLVQETYLAAFRAWQDHRRPKRVEPWMATICLNLARSGYRHRARRPQEVLWEEMAPATGIGDPEVETMAALDRRALYRAMAALPEEQRTAIALVDLAGFSTAEAARIMGTPRGTVLSRVHRGRRALATQLRPLIDDVDFPDSRPAPGSGTNEDSEGER
jgi:RNA polymerase sigma-70 factor (ECF subfamily)